ncbi:MAG: hypothetical protein ACR2NB_10590 [Solirubrobacteraceae bacterium]
MPGAEPPLRGRSVLWFWLVGWVLLAFVVLVVIGGPGPLDDPALGSQRPGILVDANEAQSVAARALAPVPVGRGNVLLLFERDVPSADVLDALRRAVGSGFTLAVAVPGGRRRPPPVPGVLAVDAPVAAAVAVGMHRPRDGGPPIGYALLDREGRVRYATLAPNYVGELAELETVAGGLRG